MDELPPFLRLPTELRRLIYSHLYVPPEGQYPVEASFPIWGLAPIWLHRLELYRGDLYPASNSIKRAFWSVLQVCRSVNREVLDLLYERLLFTIFIPGSMTDATLSAGSPKLGRAKDFTFWHQARRILLVSIDEERNSIKELICNLGYVLRHFKSTAPDTVAYLYLQEEQGLFESHKDNKRARKGWQRSLKSFASLSKRTHIELEIRTREDEGHARTRALELAEAANASINFQTMARQKSLFPRFGEEEHAQSTTQLKRSPKMKSGSIDDTAPQRVICYMTTKARFFAGRHVALQKRKERMMHIKRMYEGRLG